MGMFKIKKGKRSPLEFWSLMKPEEKAIVCVPVVVAILLLAYILFGPGIMPKDSARGAMEIKMETNGKWTTFKDFGMDVWLPKEIAEERLDGDDAKYMKLHATRDKGGFPEITVGCVVVPDTHGQEFDIDVDPAGVSNAVRPYVLDAFAKMFNGVVPTMNVDIETTHLDDGTPIMECTGTATLQVVYKDPTGKNNEGEPYQEETDTNIHYAVRIINQRPVIVWGTWDYSTYRGEENVRQAVRDGITSIIRADGMTFKQPDDFVSGESGITKEDEESGLVSVPYQGDKGTTSDAPVDAEGNTLAAPESWAGLESTDEDANNERVVLDENGNRVDDTVDASVPEDTTTKP